MSEVELTTRSRIIPLMSRKLPLPRIIETLSDIPEERVIATFDDLMVEAFDVDLVYDAAA